MDNINQQQLISKDSQSNPKNNSKHQLMDNINQQQITNDSQLINNQLWP